MMYKWVGSILIFTGCGGFGLSLVQADRHREKMMLQFLRALDQMECELRYRLTPLPELASLAAVSAGGRVRKILTAFSDHLDRYVSPDCRSCMYKALELYPGTDEAVRSLMLDLGRSLGTYDLEGQLLGIDRLREKCRYQLSCHRDQKANRISCYKTLGFCAGAAMVILLV